MVREVDPTARRYAAIVIPYGVGYEPNSADPLRISMTAPLLRYELLPFCLWFPTMVWPVQGIYRVHTARLGVPGRCRRSSCASRGANEKRSTGRQNAPRTGVQGRDYDLVGTSYDATTGQVTFAPKLTEAQKLAFRKSLIQPSQSDTEYSLKLQREWIPRIMNRYSYSQTAIVLTPLPRGPFLEVAGFSREYEPFFQALSSKEPIFRCQTHLRFSRKA